MNGDDALPPAESPKPSVQVAMDRAKQALRLVSASLPHLSGLMRLVRLKPSRKTEVASVASSGLTLIHPDVFSTIPLGDAAFVLAHELMHLALDTHNRQGETHRLLVNYAHDYIINDMLREELGRDPPLDGLDMPGAREKSLEQLCTELSQGPNEGLRCWSSRGGRSEAPAPPSPLRRAMQDAGLVPPEEETERPDPQLSRGDLIPDDREDEFEPAIGPQLRKQLRSEVRKAAAKAASLAQLKKEMEAGPGVDLGPQRGSALMQAVRDAYAPPWELALQRWMDAVAPGERTYARPSRRGFGLGDVIRPGRSRTGWTLHVVLDTSGSMVDILPRALGAMASFCDAAGVSDVHVLQCDTEVTSDTWVETPQLAEFRVAGFGYSDMSPAMNQLMNDPEVQAVLVLTDGYIDYPSVHPPYRVLWGLIGDVDESFQPAYGEVVHVRELGS